MVQEELTISTILTKEAMLNAIAVNAAIGGSTNFILHLLAIAGRVGVDLSLDDFDTLSQKIPLLVNLQPSGKYFMEDLFYAGGLPAVMKAMKQWLHTDAITVNGKTIDENISVAECYNPEIIATADKPFNPLAGIVLLKGNLCENGAVIKPSAATPSLLNHTGRAVVFENTDDYKNRIDDPALDIDETCIMVLKHAGPKGYPGMPEVGNMALPQKLLKKGVTDMIRISDGRMSGTGFGTVILHASPEAAEGKNFSVVQTGDLITINLEKRLLHLHVSDEELQQRKNNHKPLPQQVTRGYTHLYINTVEQAHLGADLNFLKGNTPASELKDSH
jgi:dihydroxy-acid dehydratase